MDVNAFVSAFVATVVGLLVIAGVIHKLAKNDMRIEFADLFVTRREYRDGELRIKEAYEKDQRLIQSNFNELRENLRRLDAIEAERFNELKAHKSHIVELIKDLNQEVLDCIVFNANNKKVS